MPLETTRLDAVTQTMTCNDLTVGSTNKLRRSKTSIWGTERFSPNGVVNGVPKQAAPRER